MRVVRRPAAGAQPVWWACREVARRLRHDWPAATPEAVWDELAALLPGLAGVGYGELEHDGLCWPAAAMAPVG